MLSIEALAAMWIVCAAAATAIIVGISFPPPFLLRMLMLLLELLRSALLLLLLLGTIIFCMAVVVIWLIEIEQRLLRQVGSVNLLNELCQCRELRVGIETALLLPRALAFDSRLLPAVRIGGIGIFARHHCHGCLLLRWCHRCHC